jgi:hypothetical protein
VYRFAVCVKQARYRRERSACADFASGSEAYYL